MTEDCRSDVWVGLLCRRSGQDPFKQAVTDMDWSDAAYHFRLVLLLNPVIESNAFRNVEIIFTFRQVLPFVVGADRCSMAVI